MNTTPPILSVNVSDSSGGAARAAYRIHCAVNQYGANSRMLVRDKTLNDETILSVSQFDHPSPIKHIYRYIQNKLKNKAQHYRLDKYPGKEDVFMSDLRSASIHGAFQKIDFDILHLHWINLRFLDLKELQNVHKPIVWTLHDCWPFTGICHYFYDCDRYVKSCGNCPFLHSGKENDLSHQIWKQKKQLYNELDLHIVTPSRWLAEAARKSSLFSEFPVTVIPNPINSVLYSPGEKQQACKVFELDSNKNYVLYGAMNAINDKNKGFIQLIDAIHYYSQTFNEEDFILLVAGAEKPLDGLQTKIKVQYLGAIQDDKKMVAAYRSASVVVVPSLSENLSNTIMEALSCGAPVVAFNVGGNSDMIDHQQNGYLAEPYDSEDLAKGIEWCIKHNEDHHLSNNARKKVEENYSMEIVAKKYMDLYNSIYSQ